MTTVRQMLQAKNAAVWTIEPQASVFEALQIMAEKDVGALPVVQDGRLVGILSERDYARKGILKGKSSKATQVRELMTAQVVTVHPDHSVERCMALMTHHKIRHLPVLNERGRLMGILSMRDVVRTIIANQRLVIEHLEGRARGNLYEP